MKIIICCLIIVIGFYVHLLMKPKKDFQILQSQLANLSDNELHEKYPIVIEDNIVNAEDLLYSLFKYQYVFKKFNKFKKNNEVKNHAKYLLLHNTNEEDTVVIVTNIDKSVSINLSPYSVMIVPYSWHVESQKDISSIELRDFVHYFFDRN